MPAYQHDTHFTLQEARALLPWVKERLERIQKLFHDLTERGFDVLGGRWSSEGNGHSQGPPPKEYTELARLVGELDKRGVLIKDFDQGVVDFPHLRPNGEEVYLCWMLEEPTVSFWHRIPEGFMGRTPVEEESGQTESS